MDTDITIISDSGKGRTFILVIESGRFQEYAISIAKLLSAEVRVVICEAVEINEKNWKELSISLLNLIRERSIRQASFVGFGAACALVQNAYLREAKLVRTMVLINGTCRPHPTIFSRIIDKIEEILPLGLPLRTNSKGFDSRSHLQRIRCPTLVVTLPDASESLKKEAHLLNKAMPSSWLVHIEVNTDQDSLCDLIKEFQNVSAKCPQKNLKAA